MAEVKYCLDTNVLIEAWQKYYSLDLCPEYWEVLNQLGKSGVLYLPEEVRDEITGTEDDLSKWVRGCEIPILKTNQSVTQNWSMILAANPLHKFLVDNTKRRSLANPWLIAHAMTLNATVVTKEEKVTAVNSKKIKIPNVCENMKITCINDFDMIRELKLHFSCMLG